MKNSYKADTVTMQVIRYGLEAVADDMGYNLMRMGRTTIVKEIMDINCGVLDDKGGILAQAHLCPLMMFSLPTTAVAMLDRIKTFEARHAGKELKDKLDQNPLKDIFGSIF